MAQLILMSYKATLEQIFCNETKLKNDKILDSWTEILREIKKIEARGELFCLIGDLNRHVGDAILGNKNKVSYGGKLIRDLFNRENTAYFLFLFLFIYSLIINTNIVHQA